MKNNLMKKSILTMVVIVLTIGLLNATVFGKQNNLDNQVAKVDPPFPTVKVVDPPFPNK